MILHLFILNLVFTFIRCQIRFPLKAFTRNDVLEGLNKTWREDRFVRIISDYEGLFYSTIQIGSPRKDFKVLFDTNTFWLWVPSALSRLANNFAGCGSKLHATYDVEKSESGRQVDGMGLWEYNFPEGYFKGRTYRDDVKVANAVIERQFFYAFETTTSHHYISAPFDGVFGLSFHQSDNDKNSPIYNMFEQKFITKRMFSVYIDSSELNPPNGFIHFGEGFHHFYSGEIKYYSLIKRGQFSSWRIRLQGIQINNMETCFGSCEALMVTSSNYIYAPERVSFLMNVQFGAVKMKRVFPEHGEFWHVPCGLLDLNITSPLVIKIDGDEYGIQPENLISSFHVGSHKVCKSAIHDGSVHLIMDGSFGKNMDHIKLGLPFFKQFFTVFEMDKDPKWRRLGIGSYANDSKK